MLPDPYPVQPWSAPCKGSVSVPGSKSLTNRAMILGALSDQHIHLEDALFSRDSRLLAENLERLGFALTTDEGSGQISVRGAGGKIPNAGAELYVGNAGTAARFLTALVSLHPGGCYRLDGDPELYRRPMKGLLDCLEALGARFRFEGNEGCFPFVMKTRGLRGGRWQVDASSSSQMLSALMMVAPFADKDVRLAAGRVRPAFVEMTARLMQAFGNSITGSPGDGYHIPANSGYRPGKSTFCIEPDATAASYFVMLPLVVGGCCRIRGMRENMLQGDVAFTEVARDLGLKVETTSDGWQVGPFQPEQARPRCFNFEPFSDTFLTLAAVAPLLQAPVRIEGIGHTRLQETDRIAAMAAELARAGAPVEEGPDFLVVHPFGEAARDTAGNVVINTYKDHRIAMSFALLGSRDIRGDGKPWLHIADPSCCSKTFPGFFSELENLYQESHDV